MTYRASYLNFLGRTFLGRAGASPNPPRLAGYGPRSDRGAHLAHPARPQPRLSRGQRRDDLVGPEARARGECQAGLNHHARTRNAPGYFSSTAPEKRAFRKVTSALKSALAPG